MPRLSRYSELVTLTARAHRIAADRDRGLTRVAAAELSLAVRDSAAPTFVTLSFSGGVASALIEVARTHAIREVCGEGRPTGPIARADLRRFPNDTPPILRCS
jgi:hypothetical protein